MMTSRSEMDRDAQDGCAAFASILPDYLDGALGPDASDAAAAHIASCVACRELVRDLHAIRAQAASLPTLQPSRDLWTGIEARLAPRSARPQVVGGAAAATGTPRHAALQRWFGPRYATRVAALAAGLIISTAGVTYLATRALIGTHGPASQVVAARGSGPAPVDAGGATYVARTSEYLYDAQIASLYKILQQRRTQLDPKTVAVIERSLGVIDTAIAQSKAALAKDSANRFLAGQLDRALDTKLELLRTVALLPSRA